MKKGISLIVLVITIVVMIILASIIILSLKDNDIINKSKVAGSQVDIESKREAAHLALTNYEIASRRNDKSVKDKTAEEYVKENLEKQGINSDDIAITDGGDILVGIAGAFENQNIAIGTEVRGYELEKKTYTTSGKECSGTNYNGTEIPLESQTLETHTSMKWRYMGIDEKGNALIAPDITTSHPDTCKMILANQGGYLYGPDELNKACNALYTTEKGTARSINRKDITRVLEYTGPTCSYYYKDSEGNILHTEAYKNIKVGDTVNYLANTRTPENASATWEELAEYEINNCDISKTSTYINQEKVKYIYQSGSYWTGDQIVISGLAGGYIGFTISLVTTTNVQDILLFYSSGTINKGRYYIRPVVELNPTTNFKLEDDVVYLE